MNEFDSDERRKNGSNISSDKTTVIKNINNGKPDGTVIDHKKKIKQLSQKSSSIPHLQLPNILPFSYSSTRTGSLNLTLPFRQPLYNSSMPPTTMVKTVITNTRGVINHTPNIGNNNNNKEFSCYQIPSNCELYSNDPRYIPSQMNNTNNNNNSAKNNGNITEDKIGRRNKTLSLVQENNVINSDSKCGNDKRDNIVTTGDTIMKPSQQRQQQQQNQYQQNHPPSMPPINSHYPPLNSYNNNGGGGGQFNNHHQNYHNNNNNNNNNGPFLQLPQQQPQQHLYHYSGDFNNNHRDNEMDNYDRRTFKKDAGLNRNIIISSISSLNGMQILNTVLLILLLIAISAFLIVYWFQHHSNSNETTMLEQNIISLGIKNNDDHHRRHQHIIKNDNINSKPSISGDKQYSPPPPHLSPEEDEDTLRNKNREYEKSVDKYKDNKGNGAKFKTNSNSDFNTKQKSNDYNIGGKKLNTIIEMSPENHKMYRLPINFTLVGSSSSSSSSFHPTIDNQLIERKNIKKEFDYWVIEYNIDTFMVETVINNNGYITFYHCCCQNEFTLVCSSNMNHKIVSDLGYDISCLITKNIADNDKNSNTHDNIQDYKEEEDETPWKLIMYITDNLTQYQCTLDVIVSFH